jgi:hypothetical protein
MLGEMTKAMILEAPNDEFKARCILCDNAYHNLGVPQVGPMKEDLGRFYVTRREKDKGVFKTLEEVTDFLDQGGGQKPSLSPMMKPPWTDSTRKDRSDRVPQGAHWRADHVQNAKVTEVATCL